MSFSALIVLLLPLTLSCPVYHLPSQIDATTRADVNYRLPNNVKPLQYEITLEPHLEERTIDGSVIIKLQALENTKNITVHLRSINVTNDTVTVEGPSGTVPIEKFTWESTPEFYSIHLTQELVADAIYDLTIGHYDAQLHTDNGGFYQGKYINENGDQIFLATTQFESTNARRAFPSLDEPALKASYIVHLIRPGNYTSISNEKLIDTASVGDNKYMDTYRETVNMSSYLVAFVVSDFQNKSSENQRVFARPQMVKEGWADYALDSGVKLTKIIGDFVGVNYTLEKMDQIAIPDDYFAAGAMENWGLITYRESYLLYLEGKTTTSELQGLVTVVAHELAHQWFGNLVTLSWWNHLWLNEGFATYFEWFAPEALDPTWKTGEQFVVRALQYAMGPDSEDSTQAMNFATETPGGGPPNWVAYQKSGSVIRMFEHFLTTDVFKRGLNLYLNNNQFQPVAPSDLYEALQQIIAESNLDRLLGNLTVSSILSTWDTLVGYPLVSVVRDYDAGKVTLQQSKFMLKNKSSDIDEVWYIPINFALSANGSNFDTTTADYWLTEKTQTLDGFGTDGWIMLNKHVTGYYRVNYDEENWQRIIRALNSDDYVKIPATNRAQLLHDSFNLARSGRLSYSIPLALSQYLTRETDYVPWYSFLTAINFLDQELLVENEYEYLKAYVFSLLNTVYEQLSLEETTSDQHPDKLNRANILTWLCKHGHSECTDKASETLQNWKNGGATIVPNLQTPYFCGAMQNAKEEDWEFLRSQYEKIPQTESNARTRVVNGLGCTQNETLLKRYLDEAVNMDSALESKHRTTVFSSVYTSGKTGLDFVFEYVVDNFDTVRNSLSISTILNGMAPLFTKDAQLQKLVALKNAHSDVESLFTNAIQTAEENIKWVDENISPVTNWLTANYKGSSSQIHLNLVLIIVAIISSAVFK